MPEETIHESEEPRTRRGIASYLRRLAGRLGRGKSVPVDEEQTVTVSPPAEPEFEVGLEREDGEVTLELEMAWEEEEEDESIETDVVASKATFELYEDNGEQWRWRLVHNNGNIIADSGEGYASKQKAEQGLDSVKSNAPGAYVVDTSKEDEEPLDEGGSKATFELYADKAAKWRWRLVHDNGEIIADGGQGYSSKQKAKQGLRSVQTNARGAPVEDE
jgi:amphi-Trp domain-containing protein